MMKSLLWLTVAAGLSCCPALVMGQEKKPLQERPTQDKPGQEKPDPAAKPAAPADDAPAPKPPDDEPAVDELQVDEPESRAGPVDPELLHVHLMDGSIIAGKLGISQMEIETEFGTLMVPVAAIKNFTPGLESHPEIAANLQELVRDLGSGNFSRREAAQKELLRMGPPVRAELQRHADDADTERRTRVRTLLDELDRQEDNADDSEAPHAGSFGQGPFGQGSGVLIRRDRIETADFTIVGKIVPQSFTIASQYGPLTVQLSDIRQGLKQSQSQEFRKQLTVNGTHLVQRASASTGIRVERGDRVTVAAEGSINMTPWGQQAVSTPDGAPNYGWYIPNDIPAGMLVAQIGSGGDVFKVGSKKTFTAGSSGTLQFAVAMMNEYSNNNFPGEYKVRVVVRKAGK